MNSSSEVVSESSRDVLLNKIEKVTEIPLMLLSLFMIPLLIGPFVWGMSDGEEATFFLIDIVIWVLFAVDMIVKVVISTNRVDYLKSHWLELIAVVIPWFRPLRVVRLIAFAVKGYKGITRAGKPDFLLVYAVGLVMIASTLVTTFEQGHSTPLESYTESLWWSLVTITTVGYGDMVPASQIGRIVAVFLMLGGIGIFGAITANLASLFSTSEDPNTKLIEELAKEIKELKSEIKNTATT